MLERKAYLLQYATSDQKEGMRAFLDNANRSSKASDDATSCSRPISSWRCSAPVRWAAALRKCARRPGIRTLLSDTRDGAVKEAIAAIDKALEVRSPRAA